MISPLLIGLAPEPKAFHVRIALSGLVMLSVLEPTTCVVTPVEEVKLVADTSGNAQRGAGKVASGPATKAVKSNFLREKLLFSFLFMG